MGERTRELTWLLFGDSVCFFLALWITLTVRYLTWPSGELLSMHIGPFFILAIIWLGIFYIAGLYDKHTVFLKSLMFSRILNTQFVNILIAALLFMIVPFGIAPKTNLVIYLVISVVLILIWRLVLYNYISPKRKHKAILIADGPEAIELVDEINNNDRYNYSFVRIIDEATARQTENFADKLMQLIEKERIEIIVAEPASGYTQQVMPRLFTLSFLDFRITFFDFYKVYEDTFDKVPLSSVNHQWFITHISQARNLFYEVVKRGFDILGSLIMVIILGLILPFIALAMRIEGRGPVFITQVRMGMRNRQIQVYKIRTMTANDATSGTWTKEDAQKGNQITKIGAILRKTSLDEFPQCINILKGEMSLIGPRNDILGLGEKLAQEIPYYNIRNLVKPGITGWAQTHQHYMGDNISPQSLEESRERLSYDLYYVKNRSLLLDVEITLRTFKTLLSRFGVTIAPRR